MELSNNINNYLTTNEEINLQSQKSFLETNIGKVVNIALDTGIRALLPDIIEEQIIDIKNEIINNGFKAGVKEATSSAIDFGKSISGIFTGKFENITQAQNVVKNGGILDGISKSLDYALNMLSKSSRIPNTITSIIKSGKNAILDNISRNIEKLFNNQIDSIEKINKYSQNWKTYYKQKDFDGMEREYKKIKKEIKEILPLENTIKNARNIENIHTLVKNKGGKFDLSQDEIELAEKLI